MIIQKETIISKDLDKKKLFVEREFDAPVALVWRAWTESSLLDQWWAPRPWKAKTKSMEFKEGGRWLYRMVGPDGEEQFCRADYETIVPQKQFTASDAFCDEKGNATNEMPSMHWKNVFTPTDNGTRVAIEISFDSVANLEKIVEMGFKEGFTAAHGNLDELLAQLQ